MKQRAALKLEAAVLRAEDLGAGQVGREQVGGELDAVKAAFELLGQLTDGAGFGQARSPFDEQVAIGQQGDQQGLDQLRLTDDAGLQGCGEGLKTLLNCIH